MTQPLPITRAAADRRADLAQVSKYPRPALVAIARELERQTGRIRWIADSKGELVEVGFVVARRDPRQRWTRDELISDILDQEFPEVCRWHDQIKPCDRCPCRLCNHGQHLGACRALVTTASVIDAPCGCQAGASE